MAPSLLNNGVAFKAFLRTKGGSDEAVGYFVDKIGIKTIVQMARLTKESWAYSTKKLEDPDKVLIPATPAVRARGRGQNAQPAVPAMPARWDTPNLNLTIEFIENLQILYTMAAFYYIVGWRADNISDEYFTEARMDKFKAYMEDCSAWDDSNSKPESMPILKTADKHGVSRWLEKVADWAAVTPLPIKCNPPVAAITR